uniref:Ig-like domain-containing protein n=1 Tax=Oreochromis aureus TaxID=47969 RepID=A0AAZ1X0L6_OREAU
MGHSLLCMMGFFLLSTVICGNAEVPSKPTVTLQPSWTQIYSGETVTVRCEIQGGEGAQWTCEWRAAKLNIRETSNEHSITVTESDSGGYSCRGRRNSSWTEWSDTITLRVIAPPKPTVTLQPSWTQIYSSVIYSGETVTVRCEIQGGEGAQWTYEWRRGQVNIRPTSSEYRISRATESDSGGYRCRGRRSSSWTEWSDITTLTVSSPPKPTVTLQPSWTQIYSGETVTVRCEIQGGERAQWMYEWRRGQKNIHETSSEYTISRLTESHGGGYSCRGRRSSSWTEWSDIITLRVTVPSKPTVTLQPSWTQIYSGETVTVRCEIQGGEGAQWTYEWRPAKLNTPPTSNEYRITVTQSDSGGYSCRGRRDYVLTYLSETITLTVSSKPKAELRADRTAVPVGGSVTLNCSLTPSSSSSSPSSGWKYYWYRDGKSFQPVTNEQISVSEGGLYSCRGGRGEPVYYTEDSESVRTDTTVSNRPVVTLYPNWSEIYRGETITVRCEIHGGDTEWDYEWETNSTIKAPNQNEYRIRSASSSNSGNYRCKGRMKSSQHKTTEWSDSVTLTVSDNKPRPVLTVSPSWLSPGASVTLNCQVEHPSAGWSFYWYKAVPDLSEKSSSYELLPDGSGTAQDSYIIHGQTHTAGYVCRAGRGDPEYHTDHSQPKFVWSADVHSAASLTVSPDRVQHFTSDSVSLTCEGNFTEWRVRKFSEDGRLSDCRRITGSTCSIITSKSDTAVYWCESGSGEFSSAVNITVQNDGNGPILVSPVHPVTEGASVSLSCSLKTQKYFPMCFLSQ